MSAVSFSTRFYKEVLLIRKQPRHFYNLSCGPVQYEQAEPSTNKSDRIAPDL